MASRKNIWRCWASAGTDFGTPWAEKTTGRSGGHWSSSLTKTAPQGFQAIDDVAVMDDLVADIDGGAVAFQRLFDDLDGAVDAGAEAARRGEIDFERGGHGLPHRGFRRTLPRQTATNAVLPLTETRAMSEKGGVNPGTEHSVGVSIRGQFVKLLSLRPDHDSPPSQRARRACPSLSPPCFWSPPAVAEVAVQACRTAPARQVRPAPRR